MQRAAALTRAFKDALLDWLYPPHCYHCNVSLQGGPGRMLCADCSADLGARRILGPVCDVCGLPLKGEPEPGTTCTTCRAERRHFEKARAFVAYAGPAASIIRAYKFDGDYFLGPRLLGAMLERGWMPGGVDGEVVVPVPLHPRRGWERGYDQALLLTKVLAGRTGRRLARALERTRYTSQQSLLPESQRWDNVRGAFAVVRPAAVEGKAVMLVDDVMTTGVTADECARALKDAGAERVCVLTLARTTP